MNDLIKPLQRQLGLVPDGARGPVTTATILAAADAGRLTAEPAGAVVAELPWIAEGLKVLGWHEVTDKARLSAWLKSGGKYLGDPAKLPWCGDFAETCAARAMPQEVLPGALGQNPFFAQNWKLFGVPTAPTRGATAVFRWSADAGHVGWLLGQNGANYVVLGGNQGNRVSIAEFPKASCIATRWPASFPARPIFLPQLSAAEVITGIAATR